MKAKKYTNVFEQARKHPKYKMWTAESKARILLAKALHRERTFQSLTMAELARRAQATPAVISRIENAQVTAGLDLICRLFKALGKKKLELDLV